MFSLSNLSDFPCLPPHITTPFTSNKIASGKKRVAFTTSWRKGDVTGQGFLYPGPVYCCIFWRWLHHDIVHPTWCSYNVPSSWTWVGLWNCLDQLCWRWYHVTSTDSCKFIKARWVLRGSLCLSLSLDACPVNSTKPPCYKEIQGLRKGHIQIFKMTVQLCLQLTTSITCQACTYRSLQKIINTLASCVSLQLRVQMTWAIIPSVPSLNSNPQKLWKGNAWLLFNLE